MSRFTRPMSMSVLRERPGRTCAKTMRLFARRYLSTRSASKRSLVTKRSPTQSKTSAATFSAFCKSLSARDFRDFVALTWKSARGIAVAPVPSISPRGPSTTCG